MLPHHTESIQRLIDYYRERPGVLGVVLGGSVAQGRQRPDSDLDAMVIVTDDHHAELAAEGRFSECVFGHCTYPEGYFDIKYFTVDYLRAAAERGSDPTRYSFAGARVLLSRVAGLDDIVLRIARYPVAEKKDRLELFYAIFMMAGGYFFKCALAEGPDSYFTQRTVGDVVYGGLRMLLVLNEKFFPCHRRLIDAADGLADAPEGIVGLARDLLAKRTAEANDAFFSAIRSHPGWGIDLDDYTRYLSIYVRRLEQSWLHSEDNVYEL